MGSATLRKYRRLADRTAFPNVFGETERLAKWGNCVHDSRNVGGCEMRRRQIWQLSSTRDDLPMDGVLEDEVVTEGGVGACEILAVLILNERSTPPNNVMHRDVATLGNRLRHAILRDRNQIEAFKRLSDNARSRDGFGIRYDTACYLHRGSRRSIDLERSVDAMNEHPASEEANGA